MITASARLLSSVVLTLSIGIPVGMGEIPFAGGELEIFGSFRPYATISSQRLPLGPFTDESGERVMLEFPYETSHDLSVFNEDITRVVFVIHGLDNTNPNFMLNATLNAAALCTPNATNYTVIITPQFLESHLVWEFTPSNIIYWNSPYWGSDDAGYGYRPRRRVRVSSYSVMDELVLRIAMLKRSVYPNLQQIVIAGHSAGGQFVNRYAALSPHVDYVSRLQIKTRFVPMNPSSYVYMNGTRVVDSRGLVFDTPVDPPAGYNHYGYGLSNLSAYAYAGSVGSIRTILVKMVNRQVCYMVGENDTTTSGLDVSDAAMLQGKTRCERGVFYFRHLQHVFGERIRKLQSLSVVPSVGHSYPKMSASDAGLRNLFDYEETPTDTDGDGYTDWQEWNACGDAVSCLGPIRDRE